MSSERSTSKEATYTPATVHPLPKKHFYSIEYPGYISNTASSIPRAIDTLGGPDRLDTSIRSSLISRAKDDSEKSGLSGNAIRRRAAGSSNTAKEEDKAIPVELNLRPKISYAHPIPGSVVGTGNLVLKVVTRRKRKRGSDEVDVDGAKDVQPEYTAEIAGSIPRTVRFRSKSCLDNPSSILNWNVLKSHQAWLTFSINLTPAIVSSSFVRPLTLWMVCSWLKVHTTIYNS